MENGMSEGGGYKPDLAALKRMVEDFLSLTYEARKESQIDADYYDGYQLTADERRVLKKRKQPDNVFNRVRPAVNGTLGVIKQGATDPKAYPRNPGDEQSSDVASKTLRFIADRNNFDALKIDVAKDYLVQGTGAAIIEVDEDNQIIVEQIRWEELIYDPRARRQDFRDARYIGIAKWMYADSIPGLDAKQRKLIEDTIDAGPAVAIDEMTEDRPRDAETSWVDKKKRRLMVVDLYHLEGGVWRFCRFHSGGVIASSDSPHLDDKGRPCCPIVAQSCYIDRENNRYGIARDMRGPQDEINKRRQKLLHLLNVRQVQEIEFGAMQAVNVETLRQEAARPDGVLPSGVQIVPTSDMASGQAQLLSEAKSEIERMSPNPALLGREGASSSGRANLVRQQAGMTELAIVFGGIEEWELRSYRQMWSRARQYWTGPMYVRVTDDQGAPEFIGVNQPIQGPPQPTIDASGQVALAPSVLGYQNSLAEMDVDIIIDTTPDTANVQQEQFQILSELAKTGALGPMGGMLLLEASSLPNKQQVLEKLKGAQQQPPPDPMAEEAKKLQLRGMAAKAQKDEADAAYTAAKANNEIIDGQFKAASAMSPVMAPAAGAYPGDPFAGT